MSDPISEININIKSDLPNTIQSLLKRLDAVAKSLPEAATAMPDLDRTVDAIKSLVDQLNSTQRSMASLEKTVHDYNAILGERLVDKKTSPIDKGPITPKFQRKELKEIGYTPGVSDVTLDKIAKEIGDKIIAVFDLETSAIRKDISGKNIPPEFVTQIGYIKGTLDQILKGQGESKEIVVKVPAKTEEEYRSLMYRGKKPSDPEFPLVPFSKVSKGKDPAAAIEEFAKAMKDVQVIAGHNIASFDIDVIDDQFNKFASDLAKSGIEKVGPQVEAFVDTLRLARMNLHKRQGVQGGDIAPFKLENIRKDLDIAGSEFKHVSRQAHDALFDVESVVGVLRALDRNSEEFAASTSSVSKKIELLIDSIESKVKSALENKRIVDNDISGEDIPFLTKAVGNRVAELKNVLGKAVLEVKDLASIRSGLQAASYGDQIIGPQPEERAFEITGKVGEIPGSKQLSASLGNLSKSLYDLQNNIVKSLEKGLSKGVEILKEEGHPFRLAEGGREYEVRMIDIRGLRKAMSSMQGGAGVRVPLEATPEDVMRTYIESYKQERLTSPVDKETQLDSIAHTLKNLTGETLTKSTDKIKNLAYHVKSLIARGDTREEIRPVLESKIGNVDDISHMYKSVVLENEAQEELNKRFMKRLAIPAARLTPEGNLTFGTKYGAERVLSGFATVTTGLEKLLNEFKSVSPPDINSVEIARFQSAISDLPIRLSVGSEDEDKANKLAASLIKRTLESGGQSQIISGYKRSVDLKMLERGEDRSRVEEYSRSSKSVEELIQKANELGVTALDVAKALDEVSFDNFYEMLDKMLRLPTGPHATPFLQYKASNIGAHDERTMREISKIVNDLSGLMPLAEPGKPKRMSYEQQSLRVFTKPINPRDPKRQMLNPQEQKDYIVDVNQVWKDIVDRAEKLGEESIFRDKPYMGKPVASSIDLSDSASSALRQFNKEATGTFKPLGKTMLSMNTGNVRAMAPFKDFSSVQRQVSYSMNALAGGLKEGKFEIPSLVSSQEKSAIEAGKYGTGGYGLNVLTELRNTADTFEDQMVIAGRLASAFTRLTKPLVAPAPRKESEVGGKYTSEVKPGIKRLTGRAERLVDASTGKPFKERVEEVAKEFQEILGIPKGYEGRADIAEISGRPLSKSEKELRGLDADALAQEIEKVIREHRGQTIEVQMARITETFLNYFGRKFSTRFGTKGVSVTPASPGEMNKEVHAKAVKMLQSTFAKGGKVEVAPGAGLGYAKTPRSVGEMAAEMFESGINLQKLNKYNEGKSIKDRVDFDDVKSLSAQLRESGNKFILDLFTDASQGLVVKEEADRQSKLFAKANNLYQMAFGESLRDGVSGIKQVQERYTKSIGKEPFIAKPIEARISSRGIVKRGLMPEILEGIVNNLIGSTSDTTTLVDNIKDKALTQTEEGRKRINEYLSALGYESFQDTEGMVKRLKMEGADQPDIDKLKEFEKQWSVYSSMVDQYGDTMSTGGKAPLQSFIAPKFLQVVEEPHRFEDWSAQEIERGSKGIKLDFQSFAAMVGIFGEGSEMMRELSESTALASKEGWELLRAFQMLDPSMKDLKEDVMSSPRLEKVPISQIKEFTESTGTLEDFKDTIFDIARFPTAFKIVSDVPAGPEKGAPKEEIYVPGPALRASYPEELMGRGAPTNIARHLANYVEAVRSAEKLLREAAGDKLSAEDAYTTKYAPKFKEELVQSMVKELNIFREKSRNATPQNISYMNAVIDKYMSALSPNRAAASIWHEGMQTTERGSAEEFRRKTEKKPGGYMQILGRLADMLVGPLPATLQKESHGISVALKQYRESGLTKEDRKVPAPFNTPYHLNQMAVKYGNDFERMMEGYLKRNREKSEAKTIFDVELTSGNLMDFSKKVGLSLEQSIGEAINKRLEAMTRQRVSYFKQLGEELVGKKKGIEQVFFQRVTPAITGKTITAIMDKTEDLNNLVKELNATGLDLKIPMADNTVTDIDKIKDKLASLSDEHAKYIEKATKMGLPVLKEGEIGLSEKAASKIKLRTGAKGEVPTDLAKLIKDQEETYVESVRYPFTGTLSVQPQKAKLMKGGLSDYSIAVPGVPKIDLDELTKVIGTLKEYVGLIPQDKFKYVREGTETLISKREKAWEENTPEGAAKARELSVAIEKLLKVIYDATPKFVNLEQKLDFDGDALFVHTGKLKESRDEIKKHYDVLFAKSDKYSDELTSARNLFRSVFTAVNEETEATSLAEMSHVFGKRLPEREGYEFLTKPYLTEQVKHLNLNEVVTALASSKNERIGSGNLKGDEFKKAVSEWGKQYVSETVLPNVYSRIPVSEEMKASLKTRVSESQYGMPAFDMSSEIEKSLAKMTEEMMRTTLWEKKYADAITGQLYKLHTGKSVEGMSRIVRVSELETGFETGLAGTGKPGVLNASKDFLDRWPKESAVLGGKPVEEFAARVNEIMRFVIQKGMDVKHAGVRAVGEDVITNLGKKLGTQSILKLMSSEGTKDQFKDLAKFNESIKNEAKLRLGALSNEELRVEAGRFEPAQAAEHANLSRSDLIGRITKHVDLEATFEELSRQITKHAIKGYSKKIEEDIATLPPGRERSRLLHDIESIPGNRDLPMSEKVQRYAAHRVTQESTKERGIPMSSFITTELQPLYRMRTSMEKLETVAKRYQGKISDQSLYMSQDKRGMDVKRDYTISTAASGAISKAMIDAIKEPGGGIHKIMVQSSISQRFKELDELEKLSNDAKNSAEGFQFALTSTSTDTTKLFSKIWDDAKKLAGTTMGAIPTTENFSVWIDDMVKTAKIAKDRISDLADMSGLPPLSPEEKEIASARVEHPNRKEINKKLIDIARQEAEASGKELSPEQLESRSADMFKDVSNLISFQASAAEQLRRVEKSIKTVPLQRKYLERAFPDFNKPLTQLGIDESTKSHEQSRVDIQDWYNKHMRPSTVEGMPEVYKEFPAGHQVSDQIASQSFTKDMSIATKESAEIASADMDRTINEQIIKRTRSVLKALESKASKSLDTDVVPLYEKFRASGIHAGGMYEGAGSQEEAILREMLGLNTQSMLLESSAFRGGAIHRSKQRDVLSKFPTAEIEKPVEDIASGITGTIDILREGEGGQKIITDIKTVASESYFNRFANIAKEISDRKITIQEKLDELKLNPNLKRFDKEVIRRLESYLSQVNIYLNAVEGAVGEISLVSAADPSKEVTIQIGKFDPNRYASDVSVVKKAQDKVKSVIDALQVTGAVPADLFSEYPKLYERLSEIVKNTSVDAFVKNLPTKEIQKSYKGSQEVLDRLTAEQEEMLDKTSQRYVSIFKALGSDAESVYNKLFASGASGTGGAGKSAMGAAAGGSGSGGPSGPATPPGGGSDDGFDDFKKKISAMMARLKGVTDPRTQDRMEIIQALDEALERSLYTEEEGKSGELKKIINTIRNYIDSTDADEAYYREVSDIYRKTHKVKTGVLMPDESFTPFRRRDVVREGSEFPESKHKNLRAMYNIAVQSHGLSDVGMKKFGPNIEGLLKRASVEGTGVSKDIGEAIANLPEGERYKMREIWMYYKKAVSEYFLKQLDELNAAIKEHSGTAEASKAYNEYTVTVKKFIDNIKSTLTSMSDIYTETGPSGKKSQFVDKELAMLTGIYKSPEELDALGKSRNPLNPVTKSIFDKIVADVDPLRASDMMRPVEKARLAFTELTKEDPTMKAILDDADLFKRKGEEAVKAWDFKSVVNNITSLRAGLQAYNRLQIGGFMGLGQDYTEELRKNIEDTIKYMKQLEAMYAPTGGPADSPMKMAGVPQFLDPKMQQILHKRNVAQVRKYFKKTTEEGGAPVGTTFTYRNKVVDPASKQLLENKAYEFTKIGESANTAGKKFGIFREKSEDLIETFQNRRGFGQAFQRVIRWGVASRTVYGLTSAMKSMIDTISDVELGIANLRQVMNPLETDFNEVTNSALNFAKEFGLPIRGVIDAMKVFAQQGLKQAEVIDMTRASSIAANVTTLKATEATEALTAATRVYAKEGESATKYLDAWTEVEARHAVTSADLANGLMKSASAAKASGVTFDELNALITGIGETTRQSGKEVGTSLRFMFQRIRSEKAPKELGKVGISTLAPSGGVRSTFQVLDELAGKWDSLTNVQRINIAQAIGGVRHYNSLIVLMEHWKDTLSTLEDSINSKGAAERRNAIVMDTYAKKTQQLRAAVSDLQVQFGKAFLPISKATVDGIRYLVEAINDIPPSVKAAAVGLSTLFVAVAKGADWTQILLDKFTGAGTTFGKFKDSLKSEFSKGVFEVFGKNIEMGGVKSTALEDLKTIMGATDVRDLETVMGKVGYLTSKTGRYVNSVLAEMFQGSASSVHGLATSLDTIGDKFFGLSKASGSLVSGKLGMVTTALSGVAGSVSELGAVGLDKLAKYLGLTAEQMAKLAQSGTGLIGSLGPTIGSFFVLKPLLEKGYQGFKRMTLSAQDYEKSLGDVRMKNSDELASIHALGKGYRSLERSLVDVNEARTPENRKRAMSREEYVSPLHTLSSTYQEAIDYTNRLADSNSNLVVSFDKFGNAVLKSADNLNTYLGAMSSAQSSKMFASELDLLKKYVEDLTKSSGLETFKRELKTLLSEIPLFGDTLASNIKISPAKDLKDLTSKTNNLLSMREKYPLTTTFDVDIDDYTGKMAKAREEYKNTYKDFKRVLAELPSEGMSRNQIAESLKSPELQAGFETIVEFEPRLQLKGIKGKVDWKDILGVETLKRVHPEKTFDFTTDLTKGLLEQANITRRSGEAFSGDLVMFTDDIADKYEVAGNQAVLKMRKTTEGMVEWVVEFFDKEMMGVREIPYASVQKFVDSVFPVVDMKERLEGNVDVLNELITGAESGLRGIGKKQFKRDFDLGARFFSGIPTTTLLQSAGGYEPGKGFTETVPFKSDWGNWIEDNFIKPMTDYKLLVEQVASMKGVEGEVGGLMAPGLREDIEKLQNVLKNNQVVIQYRSAHEDLMKTLSESGRVMEENIAIEKNRSKYIVQTSGYLKGFAEDFTDMNLGVQKYAEMTAEQRIAYKERSATPDNRVFTTLRQDFKKNAIARDSMVSSLNEIDKTILAVREIGEIARGFGAALPTDQLQKYTEEIAKTGDRGTGMLLTETKNVVSNTSATVDRLDQLLEMSGDQQALDRIVAKADSPGAMVNMLEKLAERRDKYAASNDVDNMANVSRAMDEITTKLIDKVGVKEAYESIRANTSMFSRQDFTPAEFIRRSLGNVDFGGFANAIERVQPGITKTKEFTDLINLQESQRDTQIVGNKSIMQLLAAYSTMAHFDKIATTKEMQQMDDQITELARQRSVYEQIRSQPDGGKNVDFNFDQYDPQTVAQKQLFETLRKENRQPTSDERKVLDFSATSIMDSIDAKINSLTDQREGLAVKSREESIRQWIAPIAIGSQELAKSLGMTDRQIRMLGGSVAGTYMAWKMWEKITGEKTPEYLEEIGKKSKQAAEEMAHPGLKGQASRVKYFMKDLLFGNTLEKELKQAEEKIKQSKVVSEEDARRPAETIIYGGERAEDSIVGRKPDQGISSLREKISTAFGESKKKMAAPEDRILSETEAQTGILHGIYEQTKRTADGTNAFTESLHKDISAERTPRKDEVEGILQNVEKLRESYITQQGIGADPIQKFAAALIAVTAAGYVEEKRMGLGRDNELVSRANQQADMLNSLLDKYPDVVVKAMESYRQHIGKSTTPFSNGEIETVQRAADTRRFETEMLQRLNQVRETTESEYNKINKSMEESANKLSEMRMAEEFKKQLEAMEDTIKSSQVVSLFEQKFILPMSGVIRKNLPELTLGEQDIFNVPAQQRMMMRGRVAALGGGSEGAAGWIKQTVESVKYGVKKTITAPFRAIGSAVSSVFDVATLGAFSKNVKDIGIEYNNLGQAREHLRSRATDLITDMSSLEGKDLTDVEQKRYDKMKIELKSVTDRIDDLNGKLRDMGDTLSAAAVAEQYRINQIQTGIEVSSAAAMAADKFTVKTGRGIMSGLPEVSEFQKPAVLSRELGPMQRALYEGRDVNDIKKYSEAEAKLGVLMSTRSKLVGDQVRVESQMREQERVNNTISKATRTEYREIQKALDDVGDKIGKTVSEVNALGQSLMYTTEAMRFMNAVENRRAETLAEYSRVLTKGVVPDAGGFLGDLGLGTGVMGELPTMRRRYELTDTEQLVASAKESDNQSLLKQIELYQGLVKARESEVASLADGQANLVRLREELDALSENGSVDAINKTNEAISNQTKENEELARGIVSLNDKIKSLNEVQSKLTFAKVINEFYKLKNSSQEAFAMQSFQNTYGENYDKILGGKHPEAPVPPSYEMMKLGLPSEELWNKDKWTAGLLTQHGGGKMVTWEDMARATAEKSVATSMYNQEQENQKLFLAKKTMEDFAAALIRARTSIAYMPAGEEKDKASSDIKQLWEMLSKAYQEAPLSEGIPGTSDFKYKGAEEAIAKIGEKLGGIMSERGIGADNVVNAVEKTYPFLSAIVDNTAAGLFGSKVTAADVIKKAAGGRISGPGGPREDKVPIMASPGEYVINASAANKIGSSYLDYMNKSGQLPTFRDGGRIKRYKSGDAVTYSSPDPTKEELEEFYKNLGSIDDAEERYLYPSMGIKLGSEEYLSGRTNRSAVGEYLKTADLGTDDIKDFMQRNRVSMRRDSFFTSFLEDVDKFNSGAPDKVMENLMAKYKIKDSNTLSSVWDTAINYVNAKKSADTFENFKPSGTIGGMISDLARGAEHMVSNTAARRKDMNAGIGDKSNSLLYKASSASIDFLTGVMGGAAMTPKVLTDLVGMLTNKQSYSEAGKFWANPVWSDVADFAKESIPIDVFKKAIKGETAGLGSLTGQSLGMAGAGLFAKSGIGWGVGKLTSSTMGGLKTVVGGIDKASGKASSVVQGIESGMNNLVKGAGNKVKSAAGTIGDYISVYGESAGLDFDLLKNKLGLRFKRGASDVGAGIDDIMSKSKTGLDVARDYASIYGDSMKVGAKNLKNKAPGMVRMGISEMKSAVPIALERLKSMTSRYLPTGMSDMRNLSKADVFGINGLTGKSGGIGVRFRNFANNSKQFAGSFASGESRMPTGVGSLIQFGVSKGVPFVKGKLEGTLAGKLAEKALKSQTAKYVKSSPVGMYAGKLGSDIITNKKQWWSGLTNPALDLTKKYLYPHAEKLAKRRGVDLTGAINKIPRIEQIEALFRGDVDAVRMVKSVYKMGKSFKDSAKAGTLFDQSKSGTGGFYKQIISSLTGGGKKSSALNKLVYDFINESATGDITQRGYMIGKKALKNSKYAKALEVAESIFKKEADEVMAKFLETKDMSLGDIAMRLSGRQQAAREGLELYRGATKTGDAASAKDMLQRLDQIPDLGFADGGKVDEMSSAAEDAAELLKFIQTMDSDKKSTAKETAPVAQEKKSESGWTNPFAKMQEQSSLIKKMFGKSEGGKVSNLSVSGMEMAARALGIPMYANGTDKVPATQFALVHKGESIIPAGYSGSTSEIAEKALDKVLNMAEEIGQKIATALENVELKAKLEDDTVKLEDNEVTINNVDEISSALKSSLESINLNNSRGSVGADLEDKIDNFMSEMKNKLDRVDTRNLEHQGLLDDISGKITMLETQKGVEDTADRSFLELRLGELWSDLNSSQLAPLKSNLNTLSLSITDLRSYINEAFDRLTALSNKVDIKL